MITFEEVEFLPTQRQNLLIKKWDKDFSTSEIGYSTFFEKGPKNADLTTLKFWKNKISKF